MPEPHQPEYSKGGLPFFANDGEGGGLLSTPDADILKEMERDQTELTYGEYTVSAETFKFLKALESLLGREWIEENLGTGEESIHLDETGYISELDLSFTQLTTIPKLPTGLKWFDCQSTPLTTLPELPTGLTTLFCANTPLSKDPEKRARIEADCKAKGILLVI